MRFGPILRILGTALYGFIGFELGVLLARTPELAIDSWMLIVPFTLFGAAAGFLLAPWLVRAPASAAHNALRQVPIPAAAPDTGSETVKTQHSSGPG